MSDGIPAIYDNGVFGTIGPVELPDQAVVRVFPSSPPQGPPVDDTAKLPGFGAWADADEGLEETIAEVMRWRRLPRGTMESPDATP